jgi:protein SCO1/2
MRQPWNDNGARATSWLRVCTTAAGALALALALAPARAQTDGPLGPTATTQEEILKAVRLERKLDAQVPLEAQFRDEDGRIVRFGDYLNGKPLMLVLIQYRCTMLCNEEMNVLTQSLKELEFTPGQQFNLVVVSIDPREDPQLAAEKKKVYLEHYGRPSGAAGWHWLTGDKRAIAQVADAVGFHFAYNQATDQFAHPDGVIILTPQGRVARYYWKLDYPAHGLRLGLVEAAKNKIAAPMDIIALLCFHYNPTTGKYGLAVINIVRLLSIVTVLALAAGIAVMKSRDRVSRRRDADGALGGQG